MECEHEQLCFLSYLEYTANQIHGHTEIKYCPVMLPLRKIAGKAHAKLSTFLSLRSAPGALLPRLSGLELQEYCCEDNEFGKQISRQKM